MPLSFPPRAAVAFLLAAGLAGCSGSAGQDSGAAGAAGYLVYATNERSGDISIIDPDARAEIGRIAIGKRPRGLVASPDGRTLYVAVSGSPIAGPGVDAASLPPADKQADGIAVVDIARRTVVRTLRGISDPEQIAISPDGERLYVASEGHRPAGDDRPRRQAARHAGGGGRAGGGRGLARRGHHPGDVGGGSQHRDRPRRRAAESGGAGGGGRAAAQCGVPRQRPRDGAGRTGCVAEHRRSGARDPAAYDHARQGGSPDGHRPRSGRAGLCHHRPRQAPCCGSTRPKGVARPVSGSVEVGTRPWGLALSPDATRAFTANGSGDDVTIVDTASMTVLGRVATKGGPWGVIVVRTR